MPHAERRVDTKACENPEGEKEEDSVIKRRRVMKAGCAVIQPSRQPGAMDLLKVSRRMTRPAVSSVMKLGVRDSRNACLPGCGDGMVGVEVYCRYQYGSSSMMMISKRSQSA